jgi:hypothetical protein
MGTANNIRHFIAPLNLAGNTTEQQGVEMQQLLGEAVQQACLTAMERIDHQGAQAVLERGEKLTPEVIESLVAIIQRQTISEKYLDEQVGSDRMYPPSYRVRPVEAQVSVLRKFFPSLGRCQESLGRRPLPEGAEGWFAIPRWQAVARTYNEAVEVVLKELARTRRLENLIQGRMDSSYLRQTERLVLAGKILAEQQTGDDILVVAAQAGMRHRGCSARRARVAMAGNEFGAGAFAVVCMLLTHPERLSIRNTLMIDCSGDEYSLRADGVFDRMPLFDYDISGLEFSTYYEDRSRNAWGTPSGFLCKAV